MNSESYINQRMSNMLQNWFVRRAVSSNFKSGWLHGGQNEHRRELRDSMREDNEFGDVTLVHDSDT